MTQDLRVNNDPSANNAPSINKATSVPRTPLGLFAATYVFVSTVAFSPVVNYQAWTPKAALLPLLIAAGGPLLFLLARLPEHRPASIAAIFFVGVAAISTLLSPHPTIAAFGLYGWGTGLIFCVALACAWALGRVLDERARTDVNVALVAGFAINLAVAISQRFFDLSSFRLELTHQRSSGLLGNPVNLGALAGAVLALALIAWARPRVGAWMLIVVLGAGSIQLAGSRIALILTGGLLVWTFLRRGVTAGALATVAVGLGLLVATPLSSMSGVGSVERLETGVRSEGVASRIENWYSARHAVTQRPLFGSGPGTYLAATSSHRTPRLGRLDGGDNVYADAHNLPVEYSVTTGVLGLVALGAFLLFALRRARGPMLAVAIALFVSHLVQPQHVGLTPMMFLAAGAAVARPAMPPTRGLRPLWLASTPLALAITGTFLFADHQLRQSALDFTASQALTAERLLPDWKDPPSLLSRNYLYEAITRGQDEDYYDKAERWRRVAARREPFDAPTWYRLGDLQLRRSKFAQAEESFRRALTENPTSANARVGLGQALLLQGDRDAALGWYREALPYLRDPNVIADVQSLIAESA